MALDYSESSRAGWKLFRGPWILIILGCVSSFELSQEKTRLYHAKC